MTFDRTSALSSIILLTAALPLQTVLNCRVPRSYTAVMGTSTSVVLNLTTVRRELLQKLLFAT